MSGCRLAELRHKEVINRNNGCRIGFVDDLEVDTTNACVRSLVIYGRMKFLGLFGGRNDCIIPWQKIELIGEDTILVNFSEEFQRKPRKKRSFFKNFWFFDIFLRMSKYINITI